MVSRDVNFPIKTGCSIWLDFLPTKTMTLKPPPLPLCSSKSHRHENYDKAL